MKLDTKKIFYVGLAFFLITLFWQTYDNIIAKILIDKFGLNQTLSGIVMALDNVLALILLPFFGWLSDRTNTKIGKRTPYIIVGTIIAAFAFMGLSFVDNQQQLQLEAETTILEDYDSLIEATRNQSVDAWIMLYENLLDERVQALDNGIIDLDRYTTQEGSIMDPMRIILYQGTTPTSSLSDEEVETLTDTYYLYLNQRAWEVTLKNPTAFIVFASILFVALVSMSTFRSPAVALMPDVTIKPLRSKANAIINLLGTFGGILAIISLTIYGLDQYSYVHYTKAFVTTGVLMLILLAFFLWKVREPELVKEREQKEQELGITEEDEEALYHEDHAALSKEKKRSLILILVSVSLWFTGYNAVSSKLSDYAPKMLDMSFSLPLLVAQGSALLAFVPIGIIATKVGRKKTILTGIIMLTVSFASVYFFVTGHWLIYAIFALTGIAWATINVNSYPMVVELAKGSTVGKYTGYYYTFSMGAQIMTPILSGMLMDLFGRKILFPYAAFFVFLSFITMLMVKHGDSIALKKASVIENFDVDMD